MTRIGWIVDVQNDFMLPDGRLYVRDMTNPADQGSISITEQLEKAVRWMKENCDALIYTADWHGEEDEEISSEPDYLTTFPPHCMGRSSDVQLAKGANLHLSVNPAHLFGEPILFCLPENATPQTGFELGQVIRSHRAKGGFSSVLIRKTKFNVFEGNAGAAHFVNSAFDERTTFFVCGVARDVCVRFAVEGLTKLGHDVVTIWDATHGLGIVADHTLFDYWKTVTRGFALTQPNTLKFFSK